jgi:transglutaminase-like putative cysteine protease
MNDPNKYLTFGQFTKDPPKWLINKVREIEMETIDVEYIKKNLRIIDAEFDPLKYNITKTNNLKDSRYINVREILRIRQDSCGSLATVVASVLRTLGISCKLIHGRYFRDNGSIFHAWNEVHIDGNWIPFDIRGKKRFIDERYRKISEMVDWEDLEI